HVKVTRQSILAEISDASDIGEADDALPGLGIDHLAIRDSQHVSRRLRDRGGKRENVLFQFRAGAQRGLAADYRAPRGPGAAAIGTHRAVPTRHADLIDGHADAVSDDLSNAGQRALTLIGDTRDAADRAGRLKAQRAAVLC